MVFLYGPGQPDQAGRDFLYKKEQTLESLVHILVQSQDDIQPIPKGRLENILFLSLAVSSGSLNCEGYDNSYISYIALISKSFSS